MRRFILLAAAAAALAAGTAGATGTASTGGTVAFTRHVMGTGRSDIYVVREDGSGLRRLTTDRSSAGATFSPDGTRIAFVSGRANGPHAPELYVMSPNGRNVRRLTRLAARPRAFSQVTQPAWAPDGKSIVFVRTEIRGTRERTDLWRIQLGTPTRLERLTNDAKLEANPTVSPDGTVGFDSDGWVRGISRALGPINVRPGRDPEWSPDRTYLAFVKDGGVYVTLGQSERRVANGSSPGWSPDGRRLAYRAPDGGLAVLTLLGSTTERLTRGNPRHEDLAPSWRP